LRSGSHLQQSVAGMEAGEPSGAGLAVVVQQPQAHGMQQRRRRYGKSRRRRMDQLLPRMGLTLAMAAVLAAFATGSAGWDSGIWGRGQTGGLDGPQADSSAPDLFGRLLSTTAPPSPPAPCPPDTAVANSTYPPFTIEGGGATVVQFAVLLYMFLGLAIVCDSFFEAALSRICEVMSLKDDVAGATWMAAGGSAPELATSVLGVFFSKSDVGFGTIVGSAVFNVLFVIACCAFVAPNLKLTWWPLARDASYYCFAMSILVFVISDLQVQFWEAIVLLLLYVVYVTVMFYNERLEAWVTHRIKLGEEGASGMAKSVQEMTNSKVFALSLYAIIFANAAVVVIEIIDDTRRSDALPCYCGDRVGEKDLPWTVWSWVNFGFNIFFIVEMLVKWYGFGFFGYWKIPLNCFDGSLVFLIFVEFILTTVAQADGIGIGVARSLRVLRFVRAARMLRLIRFARAIAPKGDKPGDNQVVPEVWHKDRADGADANGVKKEEPEEEDDDDDEPFNPFEVPEGIVGKFFFVVGMPLSVGMFLTIPDCRREIFKNFWYLTFSGCLFWIAALSYIMVWMVTEFGIDYNIRDSIMGITLLAMGTSVPDALSSIAVARRGHGDMAVSSSIGSNIFDILIGLPLPWFIYGAILRPSLGPELGPTYVEILSDSLAVMILSLFVMVALVITTIHISGWVLSVRLGLMMMVLYFIFLALSLLLEFDVILGPCDYTLVQDLGAVGNSGR